MKKLIIIASLLMMILAGCSLPGNNTTKVLAPEEAKVKIEEFINLNLMQGDTKATIKEIVEEGDLYKITVSVGAQEITSYASLDGKRFFPQVMDIEEVKDAVNSDNNAANNNAAPASSPNVPKTEKPNVELFVMSHCPYGTQIEKGILPVLETLGDKIDFELKFCDYAMHDKIELDEQLNQYCIQKNENEKFLPYLTCFLEAGNTSDCLDKNGINKSKLSSCVKDTDNTFNVTKNYNDKSTWKGRYPGFGVYQADNTKYGVGGSPALIINGKTVGSARSADALLTSICAGFENPPEQCATELSTASPSAGFGVGTAGGSGGTCN